MFKSFIENKLISSISQVLHYVILALISFYLGLDVRSVFLDISKVFDKLWHDRIIFKLTQNEVLGTS